MWIAFQDKEDYLKNNQELLERLSANKGNDKVMIVLAKERQRKMMPAQYAVNITKEFLQQLKDRYGEEFVKVRD